MNLKAVFLSLAFLLYSGHIFAADSQFAEANAKYQSGDFKEAMSLYEKASKASPSAAVYYNLGNASFRAGKKGKALLYYHRALNLTPRDKDAQWNMQILKNSLQDRLQPPAEHPIISKLNETLDYFTIDEISRFFCAGLFLLLGVGILSALLPRQKKWNKTLRTLVFIYLLAAGILFLLKWLSVKDPGFVVLDKEVTARYGPSERETKAFVLHEGAEGKIVDKTGDWYFITLPDKNSGWVPQDTGEII